METKLKVGDEIQFASLKLSEQEIIDFAKVFDPLDFHIDKEAASKTIFKGLIASGPHLFNLVYRKEWLPRFGKTVVCGLGVDNWKFLKPIYANQEVSTRVTVIKIVQDEKARGSVITWLFEFKDLNGIMLQFLEMTVLHKLDSGAGQKSHPQ